MKRNNWLIIPIILGIAGCSTKETGTNLFLGFNSGIDKSEFLKLADSNLELKLVNSDLAQYDYELRADPFVIKVGLKGVFQLQENKLYRVLLAGEPENSKELLAVEDMLKRKYNAPTITKEYTGITAFESKCFNWLVGEKKIRFCSDSFPDPKYIPLGAPVNYDNVPWKYYFHLDFIDPKMQIHSWDK